MGTDNLFHKRRERRTKDIKRRKSVRAPYDKVLIVCEGEKTEPNYFNDLRQHHHPQASFPDRSLISASSPA